jgi:hypothetical protein
MAALRTGEPDKWFAVVRARLPVFCITTWPVSVDEATFVLCASFIARAGGHLAPAACMGRGVDNFSLTVYPRQTEEGMYLAGKIRLHSSQGMSSE